MDFDFYAQYSQKTTVELLLIIKEPGKYQPEAVDAARKILVGRDITEDDEQQATEQVAARLRSKFKKKDAERSLSELLDRFTDPSYNAPLKRSLLIGLVLVTLFYAYISYWAFDYIRLVAKYGESSDLDYYLGIQALTVIYSVVICILLWTRNAWGWRIFFGENVLMLLNALVRFLFFSSLSSITIFVLFFLAVRIVFVIYAWKDDVSAHFNINEAARRKTLRFLLIIGACLAAIIMIATSDVKIIS